MKLDWNKVDKCKHENLYEGYSAGVSCSTPYCSGGEDHCRDCGAYVSTCKCGSWNGVSGWSYKRWKNWDKRKRQNR